MQKKSRSSNELEKAFKRAQRDSGLKNHREFIKLVVESVHPQKKDDTDFIDNFFEAVKKWPPRTTSHLIYRTIAAKYLLLNHPNTQFESSDPVKAWEQLQLEVEVAVPEKPLSRRKHWLLFLLLVCTLAIAGLILHSPRSVPPPIYDLQAIGSGSLGTILEQKPGKKIKSISKEEGTNGGLSKLLGKDKSTIGGYLLLTARRLEESDFSSLRPEATSFIKTKIRLVEVYIGTDTSLALYKNRGNAFQDTISKRELLDSLCNNLPNKQFHFMNFRSSSGTQEAWQSALGMPKSCQASFNNQFDYVTTHTENIGDVDSLIAFDHSILAFTRGILIESKYLKENIIKQVFIRDVAIAPSDFYIYYAIGDDWINKEEAQAFAMEILSPKIQEWLKKKGLRIDTATANKQLLKLKSGPVNDLKVYGNITVWQLSK